MGVALTSILAIDPSGWIMGSSHRVSLYVSAFRLAFLPAYSGICRGAASHTPIFAARHTQNPGDKLWETLEGELSKLYIRRNES